MVSIADKRQRSIDPRRQEAILRMRDLSQRWKKRTKASRGRNGWRLVKTILFFVCVTLFFYQSAEFLHEYYKYPTSTKIDYIYPRDFEFPAFSFCNMNILRRSKFCAVYPNACQRPSNITRACKIDPTSCKDNPSNLVIPKLHRLTNIEDGVVMDAVHEVYYSGNISKEFWEEWAWSIQAYSSKKIRPMKTSFMRVPWSYFPCFSENLRLNSTDKPEKITLNRVQTLGTYDLNLQRNEELYFGAEPYVFLSIHSPFVPVSPFRQGYSLSLGHKYNIYVKLEEENFLPFPYVTDCTIYEDSWSKANPQRPRSQEMCKEMCLYSLYERNNNMTPEFKTLMEYPIKLCYEEKCKTSSEDEEILERCRSNCKQSCRTLKYISTIEETVLDNYKRKEIPGSDYEKDLIQVEIFLGDLEVIVKQHFPLYDTGHLFSYIGGLMGCWLGFSIWAFAGLAEHIFRRTVRWMERIKRYFKETSSPRPPNAAFSTHLENIRNTNIF